MIEVENPYSREIIGVHETTTNQQIDSMLKKLKQGGEEWAKTDPTSRRDILFNCADQLDEIVDQLAETITSEMGRPISESKAEVIKSANFVRYFAEEAINVLRDSPIDIEGHATPDKIAWIRPTPLGVAAMIKPWNAPVQQLVWGLAPALSAGCSVLMKPSEYTPGSAKLLEKAFRTGGLPENVYQTAIGSSETGAYIASLDLDIVSFTGSLATGRKVAKQAAAGPTKTIMELSGKDALVVDRSITSVDLVASGIVFGAFSNCGQWCSSIERVFIHDDVYDAVEEKVCELTSQLRVGGGTQDIDVGPVANNAQFKNITSILKEALQNGAKIVASAQAVNDSEKGYFVLPTVLTNVSAKSRMRNENVFGPLVEMQRYSDLDQVISEINSSKYGLGVSVWTQDQQIVDAVSYKTHTGMVWVNEPMQSLAPCPWSVHKSSGYGAELGSIGISEFTYPKLINSQLDNNNNPRPWYFPY